MGAPAAPDGGVVVVLLLFLAATALAGGYYHPDDVAAKSALYAEASRHASAKVGALQEESLRLAVALAAYEEALDLLGDGAPAEDRARHAELSRTYNRELAVAQAFTETMIEDFDTVFGAALDRALAKAGKAEVCRARIPSGRAIPGVPARTQPNPACKGTDLVPRLAEAMDADPKLRRAVQEILALEWPTLTRDVTPRPAVSTGGGDRWVDVAGFFRGVAPDRLRAIARADDEARLDFQAAIEQGASKEELEAHREAARAVTATTARRRAELGSPILTAAQSRLSKAGAPVAWCPQPAVFGGCVGEDATRDTLDRLLADKKFAKALR